MSSPLFFVQRICDCYWVFPLSKQRIKPIISIGSFPVHHQISFLINIHYEKPKLIIKLVDASVPTLRQDANFSKK
jgi:hypothetical protein